MAQVSFTIAAIDKTRAAFASINQSLRGLVMGGDAAQKKMMDFGLKMVGIGSIVGIIGNQVRRVATEIEKVPGVSRETVESWEQLKGRVAGAQNLMAQFVAKAGEGLNSLAGIIRFGAIAAVQGLDAAQQDLIANEKELQEAYRQSSGYYDRLKESTESLKKARQELATVNETTGASVNRRRAEAAAMEQEAAGIQDIFQQQKMLTDATQLRTGAERDMKKITEENAKATRAAGDAFNTAYGFTVPLKERIAGLQSEYGRLNVELAKYRELGNPEHEEKRTEILGRQKVVMDQLGKAFQEQNKLAREAGQTIASGFEEAVFAGEGLRGMLRGLAQDLLRLVFRNMITAPLAGMISGGLGSLFSFGGPRAAGGPVSAGSTYLVGENGPEIFTASQAGRIIPSHQSSEAAAGGGGPSYSFTYNIASGVSRAELMPVLKMTQRETIARISEAQRRGLPLSAAMA